MPQGFPDHFSGHSAAYRQHRPHYPASLFQWLTKNVAHQDIALDLATGSGQVARDLLPHFDTVLAADASAAQLGQLASRTELLPLLCRAESLPLADHSLDLITVGQALHWFDGERFYAETRRVLKPGGLVAAWSYGLTRVDDAVDDLVDRLYRGPLEQDWPPQRRHIDAGYTTLAFPFTTVPAPEMTMTAQWQRQQFVDYLGTWSAVQRHRQRTGQDPLAPFASDLDKIWPDDEAREVRWPLAILAGRP